MIRFTATIEKFARQGEKTGWTYITIPASLAVKLNPANKKSFRVKGSLDNYSIAFVAAIPMGEGDYIIPLNATMRKHLQKTKGAKLVAVLGLDTEEKALDEDFIECLQEEPKAITYFNTLLKSHQRYFSNWIASAKTIETKSKRIAMAVNALAKGWDYGQMIRANKKD
jgi:hypothetical protein